MSAINLGYGKSAVKFAFDENRFQILGQHREEPRLTDVEIGEKLGQPINQPTLEEIVQPGETVLIVVPDATRRTASGQIVNLIVRRLIANGTLPFDIRIIFATGIHRRVTDDEKRELLTPFIYQRIKTLDHNARDLAQLVNFGETSGGIPIQLNRALTEHDRVIIVGGISFHYFAGFTGGRKLICPGLASSRTISETHKLAFDCQTKSRQTGVGAGLLDGNAVHEAFMEIVAKLPPSFAVNTIVNDAGEAVDLFVGDWQTAHKKACEFYAAEHTLEIAEKRDLVIVSGGGSPHDLNLIQAHKALETASNACNEGGTIIFLAECSDGLGRADFLKWFAAENSNALADKLCESYQVNGQTAWSLLRKAERFDIQIITLLPESETRPMRLHKARSLAEIAPLFDENSSGYILPCGAKYHIISS
ncbi:MAG: nickel-dependent lactate racemase [Pyrinomonadaceae bacterium]|nr:nickel-dependent lactate racemase [Pyrinomonadaceae bacterium]